MTLAYDPGECPKVKHAWKRPYAGFVEIDGMRVGKCPCTLTNVTAERLLSDAIDPDDGARMRGGAPKRLYVIHEGVVYRAEQTRAGFSYHGFPELPEALRRQPKVVRLLLARAESLGCMAEVKKWIRA